MMSKVYFRRPSFAARVRGTKSVGLTTEAAPYVTEACIDPQFGSAFAVVLGHGETATAARAEAARKCLAAEKRRYETGE
jgi:hypothetical protein